MKTKIYIWNSARDYSPSMWKSISRRHIDKQETNYIIFNHHLKEYRKNFKCTKHQLAAIIEKAKTLLLGYHSITI